VVGGYWPVSGPAVTEADGAEVTKPLSVTGRPALSACGTPGIWTAAGNDTGAVDGAAATGQVAPAVADAGVDVVGWRGWVGVNPGGTAEAIRD
jgi:hypothetical protein